VRGSKIFGAVALAWLAAVAVTADAQRSPSPQHLLPQANAQKNQGGTKNGGQPERRLGTWLRAHKDLTPDQQEKALEKDAEFQRMPKQQQANLRQRLRWLNSLPPQQRTRAIERFEFIASLTPQQRQQLRQSQQQLQGLPEDRRVMVHKALRHLRQMDPQQRAEVMQSDRFKSTFSDQEQGILRQLAAINPPGEGGAAAPGAQQPK
jgi:hypothetical protein